MALPDVMGHPISNAGGRRAQPIADNPSHAAGYRLTACQDAHARMMQAWLRLAAAVTRLAI